MNTGIIATRYATALLKLVEETGSGELVATQVRLLVLVWLLSPPLSVSVRSVRLPLRPEPVSRKRLTTTG